MSISKKQVPPGIKTNIDEIKRFLFSHECDMAILILGEANLEFVRSLLREARKK